MAHIPDQLIKINSNIQEAETILCDLKKRTKTENVAEQIEHFESMLNKLNSLKESYLQLSAQFETSTDMKNSLLSVTSVLQNNKQFSTDDQLEQLKKERDRLKKELHDQQSTTHDSRRMDNLDAEVTNSIQPFYSPNSFTDLVSDLQNFVGLDLSFYISILKHHIEIGSKMIDMVDGLSLSDNLEQGICLLKEVIQRLIELRERFQSVQSTKENIQNQNGIDEDILQHEMETFNSIFEDLKVNFATGVKCFKSAMDIIQSYLDSGSIQVDETGAAASNGMLTFTNKLNETVFIGTTIPTGEEKTSISYKNNTSESASEDNNNRSNEDEDDNNDGGDEDSDDSCREKDQDESMEIGAGTSAVDLITGNIDHDAMHHLRLQTEFEQKEILRLLEEKRIMQKKLADLKRVFSAKEVAKNQALSLAHSGNIFGNFSHFLRTSQCKEFGEPDEEALSNSHRPDSLALRTENMVGEMGSLIKMLSDMKTEVPCDHSYQSSPSKNSNPNVLIPSKDGSNLSTRGQYNCNSFSNQPNRLLPELNEKSEDLKQKQSQIKKLQEMLNQLKHDSLTLNGPLSHDSNDDYHSDHNNECDLNNNGRPGKGRDSVTFQEPVATFIANEELYENMREVRMRREELRDRSARNSNGDPRSPSGRVLDSGNAPGAPPDTPAQMPVTSHETASQDRTTAATWGSSSAGGDDYEDNNGGGNNRLNSENLRIRSEATRVSPLSITTSTANTDERSRVAPVGQSSTLRSKMRDSSSYVKNIIDNDFSNLKGQIENIASLCRNMALEQNRLSRDIADLKTGSSPRLTHSGSDLVVNSSTPGTVKHQPHGTAQPHGMLTDDNLQHWVANNNSVARNGAIMTTSTAAESSGRAAVNSHMDTSWEENSIASSTAILQQQHQQQRQTATWYYPPMTGYHSVMHQQNMLLQNHAMFMKLQMSLIASQLEQQRLCNLALQQQQQQHNYNQMLSPPSGWPIRAITPPYYPPPGPLGMLPPIVTESLPPNFIDIDCGLYTMYPSDSRSDPPSSTNNQHPVSNSSNPWKTSYPTSRNIHRN